MHKCLSNASCPPGDFHNNWCTSVQPCTVFFCTSTLKSLFVIFLGLKTKMWNVMDTWIILETIISYCYCPNKVPLFHFLQRNHCDTTMVAIDELSNTDDLITKPCNDIKICIQKLTVTSKYRL